MKTEINTETDIVYNGPVDQSSIYKGLFYREWLQHGKMLKTFSAVWLICLYAILLFNHTGWIIAFGMLFGAVAGMRLGGSDASEGSEEFAFTLPVYRKEYFLVRAGLGLTCVLGLCGLGLISIALDLPQVFWGLIVNSGFTEPFSEVKYGFVYWLALILPFAVYTISFSIAALARSQKAVSSSSVAGLVIAGGIYSVVMLLEVYLNSPEGKLWAGVPDGRIGIPLLLILGVALLTGSWFLYLNKNGIGKTGSSGGKGVWAALIIIGAVLFLFFALFIGSRRAVKVSPSAEAIVPSESTESE